MKYKGFPKSYTALFVSDIHLSNKLPYAKPTSDGMTDRLEEQVKLFEAIAAHCKKDSNIKAVWILGDLFDKPNVDPVTMTTAAKCLAMINLPIFILPGNHDSNSTKGGRFITEAFGALRKSNLTSVGEQIIAITPWLDFDCMPYGSPEKALAYLKDLKTLARPGAPTRKVLLMHHSINGCEHGGWTCDDGLDADTVVEGYDVVLSGHFHEHQMFGSDFQGMYLGSPMHHRFDDVGRAADYWVIEFRSDGDHQFERFDAGLAKFWMLTKPNQKLPEEVDPLRRDFVRYRIRDSKENWAKLEPKIVAKVEALKSEGFRADYVFKPISMSHDRMSGDDVSAEGSTGKPRTLAEQIASYVDYVDPDLDKNLLKLLGKEILEEADIA